MYITGIHYMYITGIHYKYITGIRYKYITGIPCKSRKYISIEQHIISLNVIISQRQRWGFFYEARDLRAKSQEDEHKRSLNLLQ